jgi:ketosteroid isomerase-like protein
MSNEELARGFVSALDRRDYASVAAVLDPTAEWHNTAAFPGRRTIIGPRAIIDFWRDLVASFAEAEGGAEVEQMRSTGDLVVIGLRSWGRSATAGVPIDLRWGLTLRLRAGRIVRADVSGDYGRALESTGIQE